MVESGWTEESEFGGGKVQLIKKNEPVRTWCAEHGRLYSGKRCPRCRIRPGVDRWTRQRYEDLQALRLSKYAV